MATSNVAFGLRLPANYPDLPVLGAAGVIHTDTETEPTAQTVAYKYFVPFDKEHRDTSRNVQVQTKIFRTDYSSAGAQAEYQDAYITVSIGDL